MSLISEAACAASTFSPTRATIPTAISLLASLSPKVGPTLCSCLSQIHLILHSNNQHTRYEKPAPTAGSGPDASVFSGLTTTLEHVELDPETLQCVYHRRHTFSFRFYVHDFCITPHSLIVLEVRARARA